jgi:hypothetical protein
MPCMVFSRCPYSLLPLIYLELVPYIYFYYKASIWLHLTYTCSRFWRVRIWHPRFSDSALTTMMYYYGMLFRTFFISCNMQTPTWCVWAMWKLYSFVRSYMISFWFCLVNWAFGSVEADRTYVKPNIYLIQTFQGIFSLIFWSLCVLIPQLVFFVPVNY